MSNFLNAYVADINFELAIAFNNLEVLDQISFIRTDDSV